MKSTVIIRADSSSTIGTGHIMRDLVLAEREFADANVAFAVRDLPGNIHHKIEEAGYELIHLSSDAIEELAEKAESFETDTIVIDHYGIGYEEEKRLKKLTNAILFVLDDTYERHFCDILLNHNIYADPKHYEGLVPPNCHLKCGSKYTLLRKEFYAAKEKRDHTQKHQTKKIFKIVVAMGGADTAGLNIPILESLESFLNIFIDVVTTRANQQLDDLLKFAENKKNIKVHVETSNFAELLADADFAIATPSVTLNEIIFLNISFIAIETAKNQRMMSEYLLKKNLPLVRNFTKEDFLKSIKKASTLINFQTKE